MKTLTLFTDGSVLPPNPGGPGGWAAVLLHGEVQPTDPYESRKLLETITGWERATTNQRMELQAVLSGLVVALEYEPDVIHLVSDSEYVVKGIREWLPGWKARGWRTASGTPVKNDDLWKPLDELLQRTRQFTPTHIRGHRGMPWNEHCDRLAGEQSAHAKKQLTLT